MSKMQSWLPVTVRQCGSLDMQRQLCRRQGGVCPQGHEQRASVPSPSAKGHPQRRRCGDGSHNPQLQAL